MAKEKWYMTTGRESQEVKRNATRVILGGHGIRENIGWAWSDEKARNSARVDPINYNSDYEIIAYTLGEKV